MSALPKLTTINLSAPDHMALARFYRDLLGWEIGFENTTFALLANPDGGIGLAIQIEEVYDRPVWPSTPSVQQMMMHLELQVDDLDESVNHAKACGAALADFQPQPNVRVCIDPAGHPFCLFTIG